MRGALCTCVMDNSYSTEGDLRLSQSGACCLVGLFAVAVVISGLFRRGQNFGFDAASAFASSHVLAITSSLSSTSPTHCQISAKKFFYPSALHT